MAQLSEDRARGRDALERATRLLQRARLADSIDAIWEAADLQWWWRRPRLSDAVPQLFWSDDQGPVAGVYLTEWAGRWQCDLLRVPGLAPGGAELWGSALTSGQVVVPVRDGDVELAGALQGQGFVVEERDSTCWMNAGEQAPVGSPPPGFVITDRSEAAAKPHPMRHRNGEEVGSRLRQGSLYDPGLDLAVETAGGEVAGYSLYWFDPVTRVGLVEPMRVEDDFQRLGLARAMLTEGLDRLVRRGATRLKVSYSSEGAGALYRSVGFRPTTTSTWWRGSRAAAR